MRFVWTKNTRLGDSLDLIAFFLQEPVSHFGIVFSNDHVMHWSFTGFHMDYLGKFLERRNIIYTLDFEVSKYREDKIFQQMKDKHDNSQYDYFYLLWLVWRCALLLILKNPIPYVSPKLDLKNHMICNEAIEGLPKDVRPYYDQAKGNTPYRLYLELKKGLSNVVSKD